MRGRCVGVYIALSVLSGLAGHQFWMHVGGGAEGADEGLVADGGLSGEGSLKTKVRHDNPIQWQRLSLTRGEGLSARDPDTATLTLISHGDEPLNLTAQSELCWQCPLLFVAEVCSEGNRSVVVQTQFAERMQLINSSGLPVCTVYYKFEEGGQYVLNITPLSVDPPALPHCSLHLLNHPSPSDTPLYVALALLTTLLLGYNALCAARRKGWFSRCHLAPPSQLQVQEDSRALIEDETIGQRDEERDRQQDEGGARQQDEGRVRGQDEGRAKEEGEAGVIQGGGVQKVQRLESVDTLRGISLVLMIFVNYGGGGYWYMQHSAWDGLTVADLVFPWFVYVMGVSVVLSLAVARARDVSRRSLVCGIVRRAAVLLLLGLLISNHSSSGTAVTLGSLRVPGVLQRLGLTFLVVAVLESLSTPRVITSGCWACVRDLLACWWLWVVTCALVALYLCLIFLMPVPGCPRGYMGPGGVSEGGQFENCTGGAAAYIDRVVLGPDHMYKHGAVKKVYGSQVSVDPEGLLGTLPSLLLCMLGVQAGRILVMYRGSTVAICGRLLLWALGLGLIAGCLCGFKQHGGLIPINKPLWSLSYVLALASMASLLLAALYWLIDARHWWTGAPFIYPGKNSIAIYLLHEVLEDYFPIQFDVGRSHTAQLCMNLWGAGLWTAAAALLYHKKIFVSI